MAIEILDLLIEILVIFHRFHQEIFQQTAQVRILRNVEHVPWTPWKM